MASHTRALVLSAFVLQLLMVGATASPLADSVNPLGDERKMNDDLRQELHEANDGDVIPVIFQLNSPVTDSDKAALDNMGLTLLGEAPLVDGGLVEGTAQDVRHFSIWHRVEYLELDKPLDFFYLPPEWAVTPRNP